METWITEKQKFKGRIFSLWVGKARLDDGSIVEREVIRHSGGVAIVPVVNNSVILIRQFRISIGREILELPAGRLESTEDPEICAIRELEEEIGYSANQMIRLASYFSSVGFTDERMHIFLAHHLHKTVERPEFDERIIKVVIPFAEIKSKLANNDFEDSKTIIGLRELFAYIEENPQLDLSK